MKVVLTSINSKYIHSSLGVWYLYSAYKNAKTNHQIEVYESTINNNIEDIVADIYHHNPDVVGFSCYIWNIDYVVRISENLKKINPGIKIFYGGPQASFDCENLLDTSFVDIIIKGEGEESFIKLLENNFQTQDKIISMPLEKYYNPYTQEYFEKLNGRIAYLETSRGCPFSCTFCLSGRDENVRFFDMKTAKENIIKLSNSTAKTIKFVDRTFNCNDKRSREIFEFIYNARIEGKIPNDIVFHCEVEADLFTQETLDYLKKMPKGLFQFEAGLQTFNPQTLKAVDRRHNVEKLVCNLKEIVKGKNIHLHIDLIAGLPFENYNSFKESFNQAFEINAQVIQLGFLKLLKGSSLEKEKQKHNYVYWSYAPYQVIHNKYISYEEILKLKQAEDAVERIYNSNRFTNTLKYILQQTNIDGYDLFYNVGKYCKEKKLQTPSLELYTTTIYEFFCTMDNINKQQLRDVMAMDRIITDRTGKLFNCLHVQDNRLKHISIKLKDVDKGLFNCQKDKARKGQIGFCILYCEKEEMVVVADYTDKDPVTGIYAHSIIKLKELLED